MNDDSFLPLFVCFVGLFQSNVEGSFGTTTINENKFMATILVGNNDILCGGTIISEHLIMTAPSCLLACRSDVYCPDVELSNYKVYVGATSSPTSQSHDYMEIKQIYYHPSLKMTDFSNRCTWNYDLAIIKLKSPLIFGDNVGVVNLTRHLKKFVAANKLYTDCILLGWGHCDPPVGSYKDPRTGVILNTDLKWSRVSLEDTPYCYDFVINDKNFSFPEIGFCKNSEICTADPNISVCPADVGGPLICSGQLVGVLSKTSPTCITESSVTQYNIYARVDINRLWIDSIISSSHCIGIIQWLLALQMFLCYLCSFLRTV